MNRHTFVAFDDYIQSSGTSVTVYSSAEHNKMLGLFDQISFLVTVEQITGSSNPSLQVSLSHSPDGMNFRVKPQAPELDVAALVAGETNVLPGFDDGSQPSLEYVRFRIDLAVMTAPILVRLRLSATINDSRDSEFGRKMRKMIADNQTLEGCHMIQGGSKIVPGTPLYTTMEQIRALSKKKHLHQMNPKTAPALTAAEKAEHKLQDYFYEGTVGQTGPGSVSYGKNGRAIYDDYSVPAGRLQRDVSVCIRPDGSVVFGRPGHGEISVNPAKAGGKGQAAGNGTSSCG